MSSSLLIAVDASPASQYCIQWALDNIYREGDTVHLLHVIPQPMPDILVGGSGPMDSVVSLPPDPKEDVKHITEARELMEQRFVPMLEARKVPHKVEVVHFLTDQASIGEAICKRADALEPRAVIMGKHDRNPVAEFFIGSAARYATAHCKHTLIVIHDTNMPAPSVPVVGEQDPEHKD